MKQGIHPEYVDATIICGCGNRIETRSTRPEIHVEICSVCHPFYTGKQRLVDTAGRVERFNRKYGKTGEEKAETPDLPEGPADDSVLQTEADDAEGADDVSAAAGDESDAEADKTAETAEA